MGEGNSDFREKKVVGEGSEFEIAVGDFVDEHQVFDEMPGVEVFPFENSNTDGMIKKAEEKIEMMNRDRILIVQKLKERVVCGKKP